MSDAIQNEDTGNAINKKQESYFTVTLQALSVLKPITNDFLDYETNTNATLSNTFKTLLFGLYNLPNNKFYQKFKETYISIAKSLNLSEALKKDPFHFLKNILNMLSIENNIVKNPNYFQSYNQEKKKIPM